MQLSKKRPGFQRNPYVLQRVFTVQNILHVPGAGIEFAEETAVPHGEDEPGPLQIFQLPKATTDARLNTTRLRRWHRPLPGSVHAPWWRRRRL